MFSKEVKKVCQDVINRIKSKNFIPFSDNIMSESTYNLFCSANNIEVDTKNIINNNKCEVCAKGAIFLSWVGKNGGYSADDILNFNVELEYSLEYPKEIQKIFGRKLLNHIEVAFEGMIFDWSYVHENFLTIYKHRYSESFELRLIEIMQDIIDDKFIVELG